MRQGLRAGAFAGLRLLFVLSGIVGGENPAVAAQSAEERAAAQLMDDLMYGRGAVGGPFTLTDQAGRRRSDAEFRGKLLIIYFGYTYCPDICPADLQQIGMAVDNLGDAGPSVQPLFITIDPARDTPEVLSQYVPSFHPRLLGLTGTPDEIDAVARQYKVVYAKFQPPNGGPYLMDHSGFVYIVDAAGKYRGFFPPGTPEGRMREMIKNILDQP